jgi:hypothetical protein
MSRLWRPGLPDGPCQLEAAVALASPASGAGLVGKRAGLANFLNTSRGGETADAEDSKDCGHPGALTRPAHNRPQLQAFLLSPILAKGRLCPPLVKKTVQVASKSEAP